MNSSDLGTGSLKRKIGYIEVSNRFLADLLNLPDGHTVKRVWCDMDDFYSNSFKVVIEGPDMPETYEGEPLMRVDLLYKPSEISW